MRVLVYLSPGNDKLPAMRNAITKFCCLFYEQYKLGELTISPFNQPDAISGVMNEFALDCETKDELDTYDAGIIVINSKLASALPYKLGKKLESIGVNTFYVREDM